jgi:hypothetical protein
MEKDLKLAIANCGKAINFQRYCAREFGVRVVNRSRQNIRFSELRKQHKSFNCELSLFLFIIVNECIFLLCAFISFEN